MIYELKETTNPYKADMMNDDFFNMITKELNTDEKPLSELGDRYEYINRYKGVTIQKIIPISELTEDEKIEDPRFYDSKHNHQMTVEERSYLIRKIDYLFDNGIVLSEHAQEGLEDRKIPISAFFKCMRNYQIVEFRLIYDDYMNIEDRRVTLRSAYYLENRHKYVYMALSLNHSRIVTTYMDSTNKCDYNIAIQNEKYNENIAVIDNSKSSIF